MIGIISKIKMYLRVRVEKREILRKALLHKYRYQHYLIPLSSINGNFVREEALEQLRGKKFIVTPVAFSLDLRILLTESGLREALRIVGR